MAVSKSIRVAGLLGLSCVLLFGPVAKGIAQTPASAAAGDTADDAQIQTNLTKTLNNKRFKGITSSVQGGMVTLRGTVDVYSDKEDADKRAHRVKNVQGVQNLIEIGGPVVEDATLRNKLAEKLAYDRVGYGTTAFNALTIAVKNGVVSLGGTAYGPVDRDSAVSLVSNYPGVKDVVDNINVAPVSPMDDRIRLAEARAIYGAPQLNKYALDPAKPIRITVINGNVTLSGVVDSQSDKEIAGIRANGVGGVFKVVNNLQVAGAPVQSEKIIPSVAQEATLAMPAWPHLFYDRRMASLWKSTAVTLEMIKWEHSIFALPFALTGAVLAADGWPPLRVLGWIIVCMVAARSAAMAFNRLVDARLDAANPRTAMRAIPAGTLSGNFVGGFIVVSVVIFAVGAAMLNKLTLELAPLALGVVLAYSYMKRITRWSHVVLGLALGIAPSAAWIAVRGSLDMRIVVLTLAVLLWVGGFDVLYACQDFEHDRKVGLNSVPQAFGVRTAFWIARAMHVGMLLMLCWLIVLFGLGKIAVVGVVLVALLLLYEHLIISPKDMRRMNAAFFTLNGVISVVFFGFVAADVLLRR